MHMCGTVEGGEVVVFAEKQMSAVAKVHVPLSGLQLPGVREL